MPLKGSCHQSLPVEKAVVIITGSVFLLKPLGTCRLYRDTPTEKHTFMTGLVNFLISMRQKDKFNMRRQRNMLQIKDLVKIPEKKEEEKTTKPTREQVTKWQ